MQSSCHIFSDEQDLPYIDTQIQKWKDEGRLDGGDFNHLASSLVDKLTDFFYSLYSWIMYPPKS